MHLTFKESGSLGVLTLDGAVTRNTANKLEACLKQALEHAGRLVLDCERMTVVDPVCLQIICSAYRESQKLQKNFVLAGDHHRLFLDAARATEYVHCVGCGLDSIRGCLWGMN